MNKFYFLFAAAAGIVATDNVFAATRYSTSSARHDMYQNYTGCTYAGCKKEVAAPAVVAPAPVKRQEPVKREQPRKQSAPRTPNTVTLADPFFQPLAGHFGVLADIGWAQNTYDFEIPMGAGAWGGFSGAWDASEFFGKADLSVGITDDIAIIGGLKYGNSKYQMDWNPVTYNATYYPATTDKDKDSGIQSWGLGGQWKFWDDDEWISHIGAYYQNSDAADTITPEVRVGYKLDGGSKIYGLARASFISWADSAYGNAITNDDGQVAFITFERDVSTSVYFEGAIGWFHKFNDQWSMNAEGLLGHYGWHTQFMPKLAFYWQPSDHFALGVYGKTSLWDNANSYEDAYLYSWGPYDLDGVDGISSWEISDPACKGRVEMNKFKDTQIGINLMLYF